MADDRRARLVEVFHDTQRFYTEDAALAAAVASSKEATKFYEADDYPELPATDGARRQEIQVAKTKTFETAMKLHGEHPDKKIAVLNFASATRPGGGVKNGSGAQEESLCRCSTLFPTIDQGWLWEKYYGANRAAHDVCHTDACIYSPGVVICKTDEDIPRRMAPEDWVAVDVVTCAAPNLRHEPANWYNPETGKPVRMDASRLYDLHVRRAKHIMHVAAANQADILVLGAFGCGAFANDPAVVAKAYQTAEQEYRGRFDKIVFAIYCRDYETENFKAFQEALGR